MTLASSSSIRIIIGGIMLAEVLMRVPFRHTFCRTFCGTLLVLSGFAAAFGQDTNFAAGPEYLNSSGSSSFARPISTPTISLTGPPLEVGASNATGALIPGASNENVLPPRAVALPKIDLLPILYGGHPVNDIKIGSSEPSGGASPATSLPAGILDTGVWQATTAQSLSGSGYSVTLAEAAAYGRTLTRHATRVYTNADIDRLHGGS
jgi:hypothetical protein